MNLGKHRTVAHIMATLRIILSLSGEKQKSHNPVHMKTKSLSLVLIALLAYFLASLSSQAVSPPPDGGYGDSTGGGNTAIGTGALLKNTTGDSNTALGVSVNSNVTTGTNIICIGSESANVNNSCFTGNIRGLQPQTQTRYQC